MNFCCIFPNLKNVDLFKEVGQIPYYLAKEQKFNSKIVCFNNDAFTNLDKLDGLSLDIINKKFSINVLNNLLIIFYLIRNAKNIDVLNCYHYKNLTIFLFLIYKLFNRKGTIYHTTDIEYEHSLMITGNEKGIKYILPTQKFKFLYKYLIDYGTIESKKAHDVFIKYDETYRKKLGYMPIFVEANPNIEKKKKNQIISVGRIGAHQKASEVVLDAFKITMNKIHDEDWILKMVGPVSEDFKDYVENFFNENPNLRDKIIFTGNVEGRDNLYEIYSESKIFLLPSRHGSFEIVFAEALFYGNYLLVTDVGIGKYIVDISNFGKIVEIDNIEDISNKLFDAIKNYENLSEKNKIDFKKLVNNEFGHKHHIEILGQKLKNIKYKKSL